MQPIARIVYSQAPNLIYWRLDNYFELQCRADAARARRDRRLVPLASQHPAAGLRRTGRASAYVSCPRPRRRHWRASGGMSSGAASTRRSSRPAHRPRAGGVDVDAGPTRASRAPLREEQRGDAARLPAGDPRRAAPRDGEAYGRALSSRSTVGSTRHNAERIAAAVDASPFDAERCRSPSGKHATRRR